MTYTEPRCSISSSPKHCGNWPPRRRLVVRHRCHFVKQRLRLAIQTVKGLLRIRKERRVQNRPQTPWRMKRLREEQDRSRADAAPPSMKHSPATARSSRVKFVAVRPKLVYLRIVLGGTAASHTCSGVGGGHFLIKGRIRTRTGIEPTVRPFDL